ncbi:MAG: hypothetical protein KGI69_01020 [Patescibacteria group bacterium]|nr:hypothetical protein [Patescibacteria group bacterium]
MKKIITTALFLSLAAVISLVSVRSTNAQMMGGYYSQAPAASATSSSGSTAMDSEEAAGQALAQKLQAKTVDCSNLTQNDYQSLGEYYMSLMMGSGHDAMDNYIVSRYGQSYDDQMHIAMGERFSGCNVNVSFPAGMMGFGPMMGGYGWSGNGYQSGQNGNWSGYGMMGWGFPGMMSGYGFGGGYGWSDWIFSIVIWAFAIVGLVALIRWIALRNKK